MSGSTQTAARQTKKTTVDLTPPRRFRKHKTLSFREGAEDIFYSSEEEKFEAEKGHQPSRSFVELATGIKPRRIYQAKITGYRSKPGPSAVARYVSKDSPSDAPVMVVIPYSEFTDLTTEDLADIRIASKKAYLNKQIGKIVEFIPIGAEEMGANTFFYGSRLQAMKDLAWQFWFSYIKGTSKYRFNVGSIISGRITDVTAQRIRVNIFGVEQTVPRKELTWYWTNDATEEFSVNQNIPLMITKLERSGGEERGADYSVYYECSARLAVEDPHIAAAALISPGDMTVGRIIKNVPRDNRRGYILVRPDDMKIDVYCPYPGEGEENFPFQEGSIVQIKYAEPKINKEGRVRINAKVKHLEKF